MDARRVSTRCAAWCVLAFVTGLYLLTALTQSESRPETPALHDRRRKRDLILICPAPPYSISCRQGSRSSRRRARSFS